MKKSLNKPIGTHVKSDQIKSEASIANNTTVVEEMKMSEDNDLIISEEVFQYNLPHHLSHQIDNTSSRLDPEIKVSSRGREFSQDSKLLSAERNLTLDIIRRRPLMLSDKDANRSPHRVGSTYVDHRILDRVAKLDNRYSENAEKEEKPLIQKPKRA